ncbi:nucleotidyltransferase domain-containing protein [Thalassobacillus hwangdonensis]|uniref:Nucleotidyltransferase domain-containing protein n=1 Tax=Thalassobacillus hwangdonensis TaxID=546108 RepID=A0ABW3KZT3_9BACI
MKKTAPETAALIVEEYFPACNVALLAGSVIRGEGTKTSDLDIVIFDENVEQSYRESLVSYEWPVELFVHNLESYRPFFEQDIARARPSLPRMVAEGRIITDDGRAKAIKAEAEALLDKGPKALTRKEVEMKRYFITDALDDFIGSQNRGESIFIANKLADLVHEFVLRTNGKWIGDSKWVVRALKEYDPLFTERFIGAFDQFYKRGEKAAIIDLVDDVLEVFGGRLFEGFSLGK